MSLMCLLDISAETAGAWVLQVSLSLWQRGISAPYSVSRASSWWICKWHRSVQFIVYVM